MSNDLILLPGIATAVRHLVSVLVGAPGPVQAPNAAPQMPSDAAPASACAREKLRIIGVTPFGEDACRVFFRCLTGNCLTVPERLRLKKFGVNPKAPMIRARPTVRCHALVRSA